MKLRMRKIAPIDVDYRYRCVMPNGDFDRIYYGHTAKEYVGPGADKVYDITDNFKDDGVGRTSDKIRRAS